MLTNAVQSKRVLLPQGLQAATLVLEAGTILAAEPFGTIPGALDFGDSYLLPGLIDTHVHINEPGRAEWEGFETATRAAAAGGITCLVDMPLNSIPATTSVRALEQKRASAQGQCRVDYAFWAGCVPQNRGELAALAHSGVRGFKSFMAPSGVDEFEMVDEAQLRAAIPVIASSGLPLLVHAEFPSALTSADGEVWTRYVDYLSSRPDAAELLAIELLIRLAREYRCPIHIVHLASREPLPLISAARAEGLPITVETCPHYLCFAAEEIADGATEYKCAPPIRNRETQDALWDALGRGWIDMIATDHSPCPPGLKCLQTGDFAQAWGGIASLSVAFCAVYTQAMKRGFSLADVVRWMTTGPAKLAGLEARKGSLAAGHDADFFLFDKDAEWTVTADKLHFRHPVTPYLDKRLRGRVQQTFVRGKCIYQDGQFPGSPLGRECRL